MAGKEFDFMKIQTFGVGGRQRECEKVLSEKIGDSLAGRLLLLPIPTTRDGVHITGTDISLSAILSYVDSETVTVGYGIPQNIVEKIRSLGRAVFDASADEEFLSVNAEITARGVLGWILTEMKKDLSDLKVGIIGYGRIGKSLLRLLLFLGADVTVYTTKEAVACELCAEGVFARVFPWKVCDDGLDLLVNTAPAVLLSMEEESRFLQNAKILDLASGKIFGECDNLTKLSSIPEAFYPISAGAVYAERIIKYLDSEGML
jgi:hypothetical protein